MTRKCNHPWEHVEIELLCGCEYEGAVCHKCGERLEGFSHGEKGEALADVGSDPILTGKGKFYGED